MGSMTSIQLMFFIVFLYLTHPNNVLVLSSSDSGCVESEREALLKWKASVLNDSGVLSSWTGRDCCSWDGITCHNPSGHVQALEFVEAYFNSTMSPWLFNLSRLEVLSMPNCGLRGSIPNMFDKLTSLTFLKLAGNELSGTMPPTIGNLTKLIFLDVEENSLTGDLTESFFERLGNLEVLNIDINRFRAFNVSYQWIPPFQLQCILMSNVFIGSKFPPWLHTQSLQQIVMRNASISGPIPDWFQSPGNPNLGYLDLSNNLLTGPVLTFNAMNHALMDVLDLSGNHLSGTIPEELCSFTNLLHLSLANNQLTGQIPLCLGNIPGLLILDLANNNLSGHIPSELGYSENLRVLHMNGNRLSGELPSTLKTLPNVITLDLSKNQLQGLIPEWLAKQYFPILQYLILYSNNFSGDISVSLCQLPSLQILNLAHNNLVGTIPSCLGNFSKMLSYESGQTTQIREFQYSDSLWNNFKGTEREFSSTLMYSKFISLSGNHLHGEIPPELMNLKGLEGLSLSNNKLTGKIPERIGNMKHLESLDLSMNRISGVIPQSLANIDALSFLNLSFNNLEGRVPSSNHFDTLNDPSIYAGNSRLCGELLNKSCPGDDSPNGPVSVSVSDTDADAADEKFVQFSWMYAGIGPGFAVGFVGVLYTLYFKDEWRLAFFGFTDDVYNKVWVTFAIKISQFRTKFN